MSRREVIDCDRCRRTRSDSQTFRIPVGTQTCPAGGASEELMETVDLCAECTASELRTFLKTFNYGKAEEWVNRIREKGKSAQTKH